jgi:catechol 2,3-dioxygenase-like lactoylglutathione lyase family enzyme
MAIQARRITLVTLNVGSLDAALPLFTEHLGLIADSQGIDESPALETGDGPYRSRIIHEHGARGRCMLALLECQQPGAGEPAHPVPWRTGISRLAIKAADVDALRGRLLSSGMRCFAGPLTGAVSGERFFCCANNDGSLVQVVQQSGLPGLHYININCTDLLASSRWYQQALGFEAESDIWDETFPAEVYGVGGVVHVRSQRLTLCDRETDCNIQLQQWLEPAAAGGPVTELRQPGYHRLALEVEDIAGCHQQLLQSGVQCRRAPATGKVLFLNDPDGVCLQLIEGALA